MSTEQSGTLCKRLEANEIRSCSVLKEIYPRVFFLFNWWEFFFIQPTRMITLRHELLVRFCNFGTKATSLGTFLGFSVHACEAIYNFPLLIYSIYLCSCQIPLHPRVH